MVDDGVVVVVVVGLVGVSATVPGFAGGRVSAASEPPLADAGLDQRAEVGETVRLDATGSRDPDGPIAAYEWRVETPDGTVTTPRCRTCGTTSLRPMTIGRYNVTVTVTGDDGATRSDTLYLTVESGSGPDVTVSGPSSPVRGSDTTYTADVSAGNVPLGELTWRLDGGAVDNRSLSGEGATVDRSEQFSTTDNYTLTAVVTDVAGQRDSDTVTVDPRSVPSGGGGGGGDQPDGFYLNGGDGAGTWVPTNDAGGPVGPSSEAGAVARAQTIVGDSPGLDAGIGSEDQSQDGTDSTDKRFG